MSQCPCGSLQNYENCCGQFISGNALPETAEQLMRSRYTAFAQGKVEYIKKTLAPESRDDFDESSTKQWSLSSKWKGLKILSTEKGKAGDKKGVVEFVATYEQSGKTIEHHEVSTFRKADNGQWYFVDGDSHTHAEGEGHHHHHHHERPQTVVRDEAKIGRNDPCPCGSGKKYKKCCGNQ